ncbi:hypothetical protein Tco_1453000, partial [Tanacetum coccineum]
MDAYFIFFFYTTLCKATPGAQEVAPIPAKGEIHITSKHASLPLSQLNSKSRVLKTGLTKENFKESLVEEQVSQDTSSFVESSSKVDKEIVFPINKKINYDNHQRRGTVLLKNGYKVGIMMRKETQMGFLSEDRKDLPPTDLLLFNWLKGKDACLDVICISPFAGMGATSWAPGIVGVGALSVAVVRLLLLQLLIRGILIGSAVVVHCCDVIVNKVLLG